MSINGLRCQRQGVSLMPHADDGSFYMLVFEHNIIFNAEFNICICWFIIMEIQRESPKIHNQMMVRR